MIEFREHFFRNQQSLPIAQAQHQELQAGFSTINRFNDPRKLLKRFGALEGGVDLSVRRQVIWMSFHASPPKRGSVIRGYRKDMPHITAFAIRGLYGILPVRFCHSSAWQEINNHNDASILTMHVGRPMIVRKGYEPHAVKGL
jgi:hypothetical protein